jgi:hypothetical protein
MNQYQQRLEDIITISKIKDFDRVNSKQLRGLMALFIKCQLQSHEKSDLLSVFNEKQWDGIANGLAEYGESGSEVARDCAIEAMFHFWTEDYKEVIERDFYAMLNKITEDDAERRADRSMAEGV